MPIITIYRPDGSKERRPIGYGGGLCHKATEPYEKRDIPGTISVIPTEEACRESAVPCETQQQEQSKVR